MAGRCGGSRASGRGYLAPDRACHRI